MNINFIYLSGAVIIGLVLLLMKIFAEKSIIKNNKILFQIVLFVICISLLGYHFYQRQLPQGMIAIALGSLAFGKYIYDERKK